MAFRMPLMFETVVTTDVGCVRQRNEDAALLLRWQLLHDTANTEVLLAAVADGMGGHSNGHIASRLALRSLAASFVQGMAHAPLEGMQALSDEQLVTLLNEAVTAAATQVNAAGQQGLADMGTTLCAALIVGDLVYIANIGDSRAYWVGPDEIQQITEDHSWVAEQVVKGEMTPLEAAVHPRRHLITNMLGFDRPAAPDFFSLALEPDDCLLLCTDGVSGLVSDSEIKQMLSVTSSLQQASNELVALAKQRGGPDNLSLVLVRMRQTSG